MEESEGVLFQAPPSRGGGVSSGRGTARRNESNQSVSPSEAGGQGVLHGHGVVDVGGVMGTQWSASLRAAHRARETGMGHH